MFDHRSYNIKRRKMIGFVETGAEKEKKRKKEMNWMKKVDPEKVDEIVCKMSKKEVIEMTEKVLKKVFVKLNYTPKKKRKKKEQKKKEQKKKKVVVTARS